MDALRFDLLTRTLASTRRTALRGIVALALPVTGSLAPLFEPESEAAKRRRKPRQDRDEQREQVQSAKKRKKKKCAKAGQPTSKKRKKCCKGLTKEATGRCAAPTPPPRCTTCPANQICLPSGVCQPCSVTCLSGNPDICGEDLQAALSVGGDITVCPGRYRGNFGIIMNASVTGAGDGAAVGANTILQGAAGGRVVAIGEGVTAALRNVRITGGSNDVGAGILNEGHLTLTDSTVSENVANGNGGGIYNTGDHTLAMTNCIISQNTSSSAGGGIFNSGMCTIESSRVSGNGADSFGGGISNSSSVYFSVQMTISDTIISDNSADLGGGIENGETLTLNACTLEGNSARMQGGGLIAWSGEATLNDSSVAQNTAPDGGGVYLREGTVTLNSTSVNENSINNCAPADTVVGCVG
jgi:hypothetical protein